MVPPDLLAQRNVLFLVNEHSICPVSFLENQPSQAVDFEGELSILLSQFFNFSPQISGPFLFYIGGSCRVQAFPLESLEALIDFWKGPLTAGQLFDNGIDIDTCFPC